MSKFKKILALLLLFLLVVVLCYGIFTGKRITNYSKELNELDGKTFANSETGLSFLGSGIWYQTGEDILLLQIKDYTSGVITMERENEEFVFTIIDGNTIFDGQENKFLVKRGVYG
jgi:hypothetical protein